MEPPLALSIIIPAKNEASTLGEILSELKQLSEVEEIIVVNDGSTDDTERIAKAMGVCVITHPYSMGNGAAIKTGARAARGNTLLMMDADGQHSPKDIPPLLKKMAEGYHMVIGARKNSGHSGKRRLIGNKLYNLIASWVVGHRIMDLTSGMRVVNAEKFREFLYLLPNGFSYPTTSTMAFFRAGYSVAFETISIHNKRNDSHINFIKDGIKFFIIIFKIGVCYSPLKIFLPISAGFFSVGSVYYAWTFLTDGRFTNMSALLFITALVVFLIGLVSEQITSLMYMQRDGN